jgi:drug/metabolite transporter (DMT)-like permease
MALLNVVFFAAFFLIAKRGAEEIDVTAFLLGTMAVAALVLSVVVLVLNDPITAVTGHDLLLALAVAAGPGFVGHVLITWGVRWVPANVPPVIKLAQPFLAGGLAWLALGEAITIVHLLGGALTIAGVCGAVLAPSGRAFVASSRPSGGEAPPS